MRGSSCFLVLISVLQVLSGVQLQSQPEKGAVPKNAVVQSELILACAAGRSVDALRLLRQGYPVNVKSDRGETALYFAAASDKDEMIPVVEELIARGADVDCRSQDDFTPLHEACCSGRYEAVEMLLKHGADVSAVEKNHGDQPLHILAACAGDRAGLPSEAFRIGIELIAHNADVNAKDKNGKTPLAFAREADRKDARLIRLLADISNLGEKKDPAMK